MKYQKTLLEDWIEEFYKNIGIYHPHQLDLHIIANRLGYVVTYRDLSSRFYQNEVIIDERLTQQEQWQDFAHELCHDLRHAGNQFIMPKMFVELQEYQANLFAYHFCIPSFMLHKIKLPECQKQAKFFTANTFNVTLEFASIRLMQYWNRVSFSSNLLNASKESEWIG